MSARHEMRHLVVLLPGLTGSVLQKDGKDVWALSGQALWQYLRSLPRFGRSLHDLAVTDDDWQRDDLGDGVAAPRLIEGVHAVPGLVEHAGYGPIRRALPEFFDLTEGSIYAPREDQNFFTFPYDWRRDNRATARRLQHFVDDQLPRWRAWSGAGDAQVILLTHSMGGLIGRYYLEVLGGWRECRALVTIGTPHRGALNGLDTLSNGIKKLVTDLSGMLRSLTSVYQLLPTYPVVVASGEHRRVADAGPIPNVDAVRAAAARTDFHEVIRAAALRNASDPGYRQRTIPWVGTRQDTFQSAVLRDGHLITGYDPPAGLDPSLGDGDGTVPRVSAVPADLDGKQFERYAIERHGWLTNTDMALQPLLDTLVQLVASGTKELYGGLEAVRPAINLRLDPIYLPGEAAAPRVALVNAGQPWELEVAVDPVGHTAAPLVRPVAVDPGAARTVELEGLPPGLYRVEARPRVGATNAPAPVHGLFEVAGAASAQ